MDLPDKKTLESICKAISVMDAILCQEWEFRYYSFYSKWHEENNERCLEMRNGSGDQMLILFSDKGCVINGFVQEYEQPNKNELTKDLPEYFYEVIHGEPVATIGTTFCFWTIDAINWQKRGKDDSGMLNIFDVNPKTYIEWAKEYFEKEEDIPLNIVEKIYIGETLTKEMVLSIVDEIEDWKQLEEDMLGIGFPYCFK